MIGKIRIILNVMFPKPALPYGAFAAGDMAWAACRHRQTARESRFNQSPARAKIPIMPWHSPYAVHVIWKHNPSINAKGMFDPCPGDRSAQVINLIAQQC
jgi:hypothetical protein